MRRTETRDTAPTRGPNRYYLPAPRVRSTSSGGRREALGQRHQALLATIQALHSYRSPLLAAGSAQGRGEGVKLTCNKCCSRAFRGVCWLQHSFPSLSKTPLPGDPDGNRHGRIATGIAFSGSQADRKPDMSSGVISREGLRKPRPEGRGFRLSGDRLPSLRVSLKPARVRVTPRMRETPSQE
jgi:hypothetical protein